MKPYEVALGEYGIHALPGVVHSPRVLKYFQDLNHKWVQDDETAWCAAFVNWCLMKAGKMYTRELSARSFLFYGTETSAPELGDIAVFWRGTKTGPFGHVGFVIRETENYVYVLGGNQSEQVNIQRFPKTQLLSFRKLPLVSSVTS